MVVEVGWIWRTETSANAETNASEDHTSSRMIAGKPHFLVHWKDGTKTYEPDENVSDYAKAEYYARCQAKRKPKRRTRRT